MARDGGCKAAEWIWRLVPLVEVLRVDAGQFDRGVAHAVALEGHVDARRQQARLGDDTLGAGLDVGLHEPALDLAVRPDFVTFGERHDGSFRGLIFAR